MLRPGILTSESVNKLSAPAEVFYRRLMSVADDYGRFDARPAILIASLYPLQFDRVSLSDISLWLSNCQEFGLISVYEVEGKPYLEIVKFDQRTRSKSKWPDPKRGKPFFADNLPQPADICSTKLQHNTLPNTNTHTNTTTTTTTTAADNPPANDREDVGDTVEKLSLEACRVFTPDIHHAPAGVKANVYDLIQAGHRPERLRMVFDWARKGGKYKPKTPASLTDPEKFPGYAATAMRPEGEDQPTARKRGFKEHNF